MKPTQFTQDNQVIKEIAGLSDYFASTKLKISDIIDDDDNQYVDLVQEGGGVLGIALVGYIYTLEEMGIRFSSLAGTSAGSITTLLLAAIGKPSDKKSKELITLIANKNFFDFVDGGQRSRSFITELTGKKRKFWIITKGLLIFRKLNRKLGLNPGDNFKLWIKDILANYNINTTKDLKSKMRNLPNSIRLREGVKGSNVFNSEIKIISSDLTTNTKVVFPEMSPFYYKIPDNVNPSEFVRASMSIPVFFMPHDIYELPMGDTAKDRWKNINYYGKIPKAVKLIDGGIMSNFPIDAFHNRNKVPRKPTLGIKLGEDRAEINFIRNIFQLIYSTFNSARQLRDIEFIFNNQEFKKLVAYIDLKEYNWLDFNLLEEDKVGLFRKGVVAASEFLKGFDWEGYKKIRERQILKNLNEIA